jgi:hypothetical protein
LAKIADIGRKILDTWRFRKFERSIHQETWNLRDQVIPWAEACAAHCARYETAEAFANSADPIVRQGHELVETLKKTYHNKFVSNDGLRILIHLPSAVASPGGHSAISNLVQSLTFLGVPVRYFGNEGVTELLLAEFKPSVMLVSDYKPFLSVIDWEALERYRSVNKLLVGLTASLEEYGNSPLSGRLIWAGEHGVDFYFSFRSQGYLTSRKEYVPFFEAGYKILRIEFGVNPLVFFPVPGVARDLNYVFLASSNRDKFPRYISYLGDVMSKYPGVIDGPGWSRIKNFSFNATRDRYLYARAKVGINLHLEEQITWACELNERTYMLAACGTPQLVDNPKILSDYFSADAFFVASSPREYSDMFRSLLAAPESCQGAVLKAQREVFERHTTFHRADGFVRELQGLL